METITLRLAQLFIRPLALFCASMLLIFSIGCTKTSGVVTDVNVVPDGLLVTKCDEIAYWDLGVIIMGQGNCRNETVRK